MKNFVCKSRAEFVVKENLTVVVGCIYQSYKLVKGHRRRSVQFNLPFQ